MFSLLKIERGGGIFHCVAVFILIASCVFVVLAALSILRTGLREWSVGLDSDIPFALQDVHEVLPF